ncbi:MAG TPA: FAD-binding protein [Thermoanaerobaculia bacterium]|nr:FAD-binding protein [Thermoanaerobaculia bacterium]
MAVSNLTEREQALQGLKEKMGERIVLDLEERERFRTDFGKIVHRTPGAVARCRNAEDVAEVVRWCRRHGVPVVGRGQGHTQTGQSTTEGGVVLDTSSMQTIHEVDEDGPTVLCDGGVVWRALVQHVVPMGLVPPTLTNNLGVTIGGTLSVAGLGVASFRYGAQVDNVLWLEVVTGTGEIVHCSADENRDLFDVVRSGLSQFGIITRARLRLRRAKPRVRKHYLLYDDLGALMRDVQRAMRPVEEAPQNAVVHTIESWCTPCFQGARKIGDGMELGVGMQTFAYWMYPLHVTEELDEGEEGHDSELLSLFEPYRHLDSCDFTQLEFCERLLPLFELWDRSGYSAMPHPWMETVLPWDRAAEFIELVLSNLPPQALGPGGHILLWPSRGDTSTTPLFMHPGGEMVMGWGILPAVPERFLEQALAQLDMASELSITYGGKRYLSGYITFDTPERWAAHFGDRWPAMVEAKKKYDPDGILNPGFITWP